ncbi:MAG TPA: metabolite traffic protein EboE [Candidatus Saccharimonadales bacterium]|nr:metabolite traffic protein EboE [Candidatus Saccharimonadales bacterium]
MKLNHGIHLAYCTNIHRGENWAETFDSLQRFTLPVRDRVSSGQPYAIGLRLSDQASRELSDGAALLAFQKWLDKNQCYIFTINGFPYGKFHGSRVKEQVYAPDWTTRERLEFTNRLFNILSQLVPSGIEGSVSTVPCSFKEFIHGPEQVKAMRHNLWSCVEHIALLSEKTGRMLHLGLEPEPLCFLETSQETVDFINQMRAEHPNDPRLEGHLGVNYDTCHLAVEFEEPREALRRLRNNKIKISKIHLSSALKVQSTPEARSALSAFADDIYFHQVIERATDGSLKRYRDLDLALSENTKATEAKDWRIHFHIPLHSTKTELFDNTSDHLLGVLDVLQEHPALCSHLEMETYTWEVMPQQMKNRSVVDQLVSEYEWTLQALNARGLAA